MILFLNDIAGSEILLILVFILMFFGSKSIPGLARTMGRTIHQIKEASADIQSEIKKSTGEMKGDLNLQGLLKETTEDIKRPLDQMAVELDNAVKYEPPSRKSHLEQPKEIPTHNVPAESVTEATIKTEIENPSVKLNEEGTSTPSENKA